MMIDRNAHERACRRAAQAVARIPFPWLGERNAPSPEAGKRASLLERDALGTLADLGLAELREAAELASGVLDAAHHRATAEREMKGAEEAAGNAGRIPGIQPAACGAGPPSLEEAHRAARRRMTHALAAGVGAVAAFGPMNEGTGWKSPQGTSEIAEALGDGPWEDGDPMHPRAVAERAHEAAEAMDAASSPDTEDLRLGRHRRGAAICSRHDTLLGCIALWRTAVRRAGDASGWDGFPEEGPLGDLAEAQRTCRAGARLAKAAGAGDLGKRAFAIEWHAIEMEGEGAESPLEDIEALRQEMVRLLKEAEALHEEREAEARADADAAEAAEAAEASAGSEGPSGKPS